MTYQMFAQREEQMDLSKLEMILLLLLTIAKHRTSIQARASTNSGHINLNTVPM
jgi:hypothetical protein